MLLYAAADGLCEIVRDKKTKKTKQKQNKKKKKTIII